jgi:predicted permease
VVHRSTDPGRSFQWAREGTISAAPLSHDDAGVEAAEIAVARLLIAVVVATLLIAAVNVVNLLLARVTRRGHEIAVRLGLGASRARIVRLLLTESVVLALVGGLVGLPILWSLATVLRRVLLPGVAWPASPLAPRVLLATLGVTLLTGLVAGLIPARRGAATDPRRSLRSDGGGGTTRGRLRVHLFLATAQVTLATALLAGAGLFVKSFWNLYATDLGYEARRVTAFELGSLDPNAFAGAPEGDGPVLRQALELVRADPAVVGATLAVGLPLHGGFGLGVRVPGLDSVPAFPGGGPWLTAVDGDYFATLGTEVVAGRAFTNAEVDGLERVVVVSEAMAAALWPRGGALGACLHIRFEGDPCFRVVGVAEDVRRSGYREPPSMQYYVPLGHERGTFGGTLLAVRTTGEAGVSERIRRALLSLDPRIDYVDVTTLAGVLEPEIRPWRLGAIVLGLAALLATLVSVLGVYGVLSYLVAQRRRELGVRVALGASGASLQRLVLRRGASAASVGVGLGLVVVALASGWLEPLLFETSATDPLVLATVATLLLVAALAACALPARQAARVEPVSCLKGE